MAGLKTLKNDASVEDFINKIENERKRKEAFEILELYKDVTGEKPVMWGGSIVGFGEYHYKSERSTQEGDWPMAAFSPRKTKLSLYIMSGVKRYPDLLDQVGKYKNGVSCLYINKLADVDMEIVREIVKRDFEYMKKNY